MADEAQPGGDTGLPVLADPVANEIANLDRARATDYDGFMRSGKADRLLTIHRSQVAGTPVQSADGIDGRMKQLRAMMWNPDGSVGPYYRGPDSKRLQAEFATLAEAKAALGEAATTRPSQKQSVALSNSPVKDAAAILKTLPAQIAKEWAGEDGSYALARGKDAVQAIVGSLPAAIGQELALSFDTALSEPVRVAVLRELGSPMPSGIAVTPTTPEGLAAFKKAHPQLVTAWGQRAGQRLGILRQRIGNIIRNAGHGGAAELDRYYSALTPAEQNALCWFLSGSGGGR